MERGLFASGLHVAIIMDGNGRWAAARRLPRSAGHQAGVRAVRRIVEAAPECGIEVLTLYAFSSDNWKRPPREVSALMRLFVRSLHAETGRLAEAGVRLTVIGRRDRWPAVLAAAVGSAEKTTVAGTRLHLRVAVDYSARDLIVLASARQRGGSMTREAFSRLLAQAMHDPLPLREVDLLVRTGGEQRLSDFLLWESAYAELYFTPRMWPDFSADDLRAAMSDFGARERRFGRVPEVAAG
ncbi:MAG: di-trans,poly-cis-decaprenylcistransferase [Gemmatimonadaceae bacterium]